MSRAIEWVRDLGGGDSPTLSEALSGAAIADGVPLYWSSGKLVTQPGGSDTNVVAGISQGAVAGADEAVSFIPALPQYIFKLAKSGSPVRGVKYGLTTGFALDATNTTQVRARYFEIADDGGVYVYFTDWLS